MAYVKYTWQNFPNVTTPITKANLDHLETQYDEAIAEAHPAFTELAGGEAVSAGVQASWENWDISAIIPAEAIYALISMFNNSGNSAVMGARKNGSALVRTTTIAPGTTAYLLTEVDANRILEIWDSLVGLTGDFGVVGYWAP